MAATSRLLYNAVLGMSREELIQYVSKYAETVELKVLLNTFDEIRKGCVLNDEMNTALSEIETQLKKHEVTTCSITVGEAYLKMIEGRILLLLLHQSLARDLRDNKLAFAIGQKVTALFTEYIEEGGKRSFTSPRYNFKHNNMKVERGIIIADEQGIVVSSPGHIYHLNHEAFFKQSLKNNHKVLGVIVNNKFSVCREFITTTGHFVFGYVQKAFPKEISIHTINEFDLKSFNPFKANYSLGEVVRAEIS